MKTSFSLDAKNIILTGAAGILGKKLSQGFINAGANIALIDINKETLLKLRYNLKPNNNNKIVTYVADITKEKEVNKTINLIHKDFGSIDVLHNNAATKGNFLKDFLKPYEEYKPSTWNEVMDGNLTSMFLTTKAVGKIMKKQKKGSIIQTASIYGIKVPNKELYRGSKYNGLKISTPAIYSVSKSGVIALTKYLASYWGNYNIRVNSISPGGIYSGQNSVFVKNYSKYVPLGRMGSEKDVLNVAIFLASDASDYITGQNILVDGGYSL